MKHIDIIRAHVDEILRDLSTLRPLYLIWGPGYPTCMCRKERICFHPKMYYCFTCEFWAGAEKPQLDTFFKSILPIDIVSRRLRALGPHFNMRVATTSNLECRCFTCDNSILGRRLVYKHKTELLFICRNCKYISKGLHCVTLMMLAREIMGQYLGMDICTYIRPFIIFTCIS